MGRIIRADAAVLGVTDRRPCTVAVVQRIQSFGFRSAADRAGVGFHARFGAGRVRCHCAAVPGMESRFGMSCIIRADAAVLRIVINLPVTEAVPGSGTFGNAEITAHTKIHRVRRNITDGFEDFRSYRIIV